MQLHLLRTTVSKISGDEGEFNGGDEISVG